MKNKKKRSFNRVDFDPFKKIMFDLSSRGKERNDKKPYFPSGKNAQNRKNHIEDYLEMVCINKPEGK